MRPSVAGRRGAGDRTLPRARSGRTRTMRPMVDFSLTDENRLVQQSARAFAEAEILPLHPRVGREGRGPPRGVRQDGRAGVPRRADPRGVRRRRGWTTSASRILCEELERADTAFRVVQSVHVGLNSLALLQWGTEEQRQRWLVPQARGEKLATFGLTEPGVGTDAGQPRDDRPPRRRRLPAQRPEDLDLAGRHRRPLPGLRHGRPLEEAQGRDRVPARARDGRPDDRHAPRQARHPGRQHRADQPRRRRRSRSRTGSARKGEGFLVAMSAIDQGRFTVAAGAVGLAQACLDAQRRATPTSARRSARRSASTSWSSR